MTINEIIKTALDPLGHPVKPGEYKPPSTGKKIDTYITFNYFSTPDDFGDDEPGHELYSVQVHLFCPADFNSLKLRKDIKNALYKADFTYPSVTDASDSGGQHYIFECDKPLGVE